VVSRGNRLLFALGIRELKANSNNNLANGRGTGYIIISTGKCRAFEQSVTPAHHGEVKVGFRAGYINSYLIDKYT
jgi:hypothetical protein